MLHQRLNKDDELTDLNILDFIKSNLNFNVVVFKHNGSKIIDVNRYNVDILSSSALLV